MPNYKDIFDKNIERVDSLLALYTELKEDGVSDKRKEYKHTDILRSAVVFLHSSFEEYFRNVLIEWLPFRADENTIGELNLPKSAGKRAEKFNFNGLMEYKSLTIEELLKKSFCEYMYLKSFNNYTDIVSNANKVKLDLSSFKYQDTLNKAIQRRHKIVHEADSSKDKNDKDRLTPIRPGDIMPWKEAYLSLVEIINAQVMLWEKNNGQTNH